MDSNNPALKYINGLISKLSGIYGNAYSDVLKLTEVKNAIAAGEEFTWKGNSVAENKLNNILNSLSQKTYSLIQNGITGSWKLGENEVKDDILKQFGKTKFKPEVNATLEQAVKDQRSNGMSAHQLATQKRNGLNLSDRVWNLAGNAKKELEIIIQNGIAEGKSADDLSKELTKYLNEPNKLFRRIKVDVFDKKTGEKIGEEFKLSKAAKEYKPGQGVYRSSYKNAMRLAITEMNRAYRRAEWESYQNNPLIKGYRIELGNNHTTINQKTGQREPLYDICDELKGEYPKTFLWEGWHPHCRCRMIPVVLTREEMKERMIARRDEKLNEWKPKNEITKVPEKLNEWIDANKTRIENATKMPFWIQDNFIKGNTLGLPILQPHPQLQPATPTPATPKVDIDKILNQVENNIRGNKNFETGVVIDETGNIIIDKRGRQYSVAFTDEEIAKLQNTIFTHNHPRGWQFGEKSVRRIGNSFSWTDINTAIKYDLKEMRAVTPTYTFSMKRPPNGWPDISQAKTFFDAQNKNVKSINMEYVKKFNCSETAIERAETIHFHIVWKEWIKSFKKIGIDIEYTKQQTL